ncbi:MAG TPA: argininosuccinate synthase domain-containing protein, partial [Ktedonobacteraceae bacterium]|nr:argininosuccinate synthase domain-containing protein [Ktedonobacteraceae bacterium]
MTTINQGGKTQATTIVQHNALDTALQKLAAVEVPQGHSIALAYSGGLDSTLCVKLSQEKYHASKLTAISVDVGQSDEEIQTSVERAQQLGITPLVIDAKAEFTQHWLTKAIWANSDYNGYPISTSMTRQLIAAKVALKALELG